MDYAEHASALWFFVLFAEDHPEYRHHVLGPNGLSLVISRLQGLIPVSGQTQTSPTAWRTFQSLCGPLAGAAYFVWAVPTLLAVDSCNILLQLLVYVASIHRLLFGANHIYFSFHNQLGRQNEWIDYRVIAALRGLAVVGGDPGRRAVREALTVDNVDILRGLRESSWKWDWVAVEVRRLISEFLKE